MAKILAVDDEPAILEMIESILNKDGHLVTKVSNLSIVPSLLFIESAVVCGNLQLLIFAVLFAPCHILISCMNAILKMQY